MDAHGKLLWSGLTNGDSYRKGTSELPYGVYLLTIINELCQTQMIY